MKILHSRIGQFSLFAGLAFGTAAGIGATPSPDDDLAGLLARYQSWRGGGAFAAMQSLHIEGAIEISGLSGTLESIETSRGESFQKLDLGVVKQIQAAARDSGWVMTGGGQIESLAADMVEDARRESLLDFPVLLNSSSGARLTLRPDETHDGRRWRVVHIDFGDRNAFDLLLDPTTGAQHGYRRIKDNEIALIRQSDWRIVDGVRFPYLVETLDAIPQNNSTLKVTHVELNNSPPQDWLKRPAAAAKVSFADGRRRTDWLAFDFSDRHSIYIPAVVNGVAVKVLLDSGAAATALDSEFAARAGIKAGGAVAATGVTGSDTASLAGNVSITLGQLTLNNLTVAVLPLAPLAAAAGKEFPVILGKELLNEVVVDIDFDRQRIAFERPDGYSPPPEAKALELKSNGQGLRTVPLAIEDGPWIPAEFDLGNQGTLFVSATYWRRAHLDANRNTSVTASFGVGGSDIWQLITAASVRIGDLMFSQVPVELCAPKRTGADSDRTPANVGLDVWSRFRVITDYPADKVFLVPSERSSRTPFNKDRTGLGLERGRSGILVRAVAGSSPAARQGWRVGDRIETLNGASALAARSHDWTYAPRGTVVSLGGVDANGRPFARKLVLEDFF